VLPNLESEAAGGYGEGSLVDALEEPATELPVPLVEGFDQRSGHLSVQQFRDLLIRVRNVSRRGRIFQEISISLRMLAY
jgi:hypothetical protein